MKSFTLIETLIYISIISLIMFFIFISGLNFLDLRYRTFYLNGLINESIFLNKKIFYYFTNSTDFSLATSPTSTTIIFISTTSSSTLVLNKGIFFLNKAGQLIQLTSSHFDFSSSTFNILTGNKKGLLFISTPKVKEKNITLPTLEYVYFLK